MSAEQEVGVIFPVSGLDVTCEYGRQPPDTAASGQNVRTHELLTSRARGGSRQGLSKYINETVNGANEVQHLAVLVDPQSPALAAANAVDGGVESATVPGWFVRQGGSGIAPNVNVTNSAGGPIAFVQSGIQIYETGLGVPVREFTLDSQPGLNNTIVVVVCELDNSAPGGVSVTNANLNAFTQAGSYQDKTWFGSSRGRMSIWFRRANAGSPDQTIRVTAGANSELAICALEYSGIASTGAFDVGSGNEGTSGVDGICNATAVSPTTENQVIICAIATEPAHAGHGATANNGFTIREKIEGDTDTQFPGLFFDTAIWIIDRLNSDFPTSYTPSITGDDPTHPFMALSASFKEI